MLTTWGQGALLWLMKRYDVISCGVKSAFHHNKKATASAARATTIAKVTFSYAKARVMIRKSLRKAPSSQFWSGCGHGRYRDATTQSATFAEWLS